MCGSSLASTSRLGPTSGAIRVGGSPSRSHNQARAKSYHSSARRRAPRRRGLHNPPERLPALPAIPLRTRVKPSWRCETKASRPVKPPGLSQATTHESPASSGVIPGPSSWPWRGRPDSSRSVSARAEASRRGAPRYQRFPEVGCAFRPGRSTRRRPRPCSPYPRRHGHSLPVQLFHPKTADGGGLWEGLGQSGPRRGPWTANTALSAVTSCLRSPPDPGGVGGVGHNVEALLLHPPDDDVVEHRTLAHRADGCTAPCQERSWPRSLVRARLERGFGVGPRDAHSTEVADVENGHLPTAGHVLGEVPRSYSRGISQPPKPTRRAPWSRCHRL